MLQDGHPLGYKLEVGHLSRLNACILYELFYEARKNIRTNLHKTVTKLPHNVAFAELRRYFPRLNVNFLPRTIKSKS